MAAHDDEDDLFKHTSMTFGEHLEELRACLLKAVLSLAVGFGIGLWFAPNIVQWIQAPLEGALENYYSTEAVEYIDKHLPPEMRENEQVREQARKIVFDEGLVPQEAYVAPGELFNELRKKYPQTFDKVELPSNSNPNRPALAKSDLMKIFLWRPLSDDDRLKLKIMNVQESFMIYIKAALLAGAIISSPLVFYFLWSFVAAGLYPHEKSYIHTFLPVSVLLFVSGAALAFTLVFPPVLAFFFSITKSMGQEMEPRISEWLSFVLMLPLGFGISFQLPLVMLFLERIHVFDVKTYLSKWRIAVLAMAIASMVLSPGGDPYSMMMMLVPLIGLYFGGVALCKWMPSPGGSSERRSKAVATRD